jgi:hypothetical protein
MYTRTLERYFSFRQQYLTNEVNKNNESPLKAELERWRADRPSWKINRSLFANLETYSFDDEIQRVTPTGWLSDADQRAVESYKKEMLNLFHGVEAKGGFTAEAADYYDKYLDTGGQDKKIIEVFGFNPSEVR